MLLLVVSGCAQKHFTPVINTDFDLNAVYKTGDFSCLCTVEMKNNAVTVTSISGKTKGLSVTYDGKNTSFLLNGKMQNSVSSAQTPAKNPSKLLYSVFTSLENCDDIKIVDGKYNYSGKTDVGNFLLVQSVDNNKYESVSIPDADFKMEFV